MRDDNLIDAVEEGDRDTWFNPYRVPKTERARELVVSEVLHQLQNYESLKGLRQRARKPVDQETFETTVTAVIADLIHFHLAGSHGALVVTRSKRLLGKPSRYRPAIYNRTFPVILDRLASPEMAFVEQSKGHVLDFERGGRKRTTLWPGYRLIAAIERRGLTFDDLTTSGIGEPIVLKTARSGWWHQADLMEYEDTEATKQYRREMVEINDWLEAAHLDFDQSVAPETRVDLSERRLRRIFTRTSFESGGRLFGGFWQLLPKQTRSDGVWIDGEPISSLDYSQMNPRIAYGLAKQVPPLEDVYRVPGFEDGKHRDGIKQFFNAMLFTTKPITRMPKGVRENFPAT